MWRLRWRWCHTQEEKWIWWTHMIREKQPFHNVGVKVWEWRSPWIICNKHIYIYIFNIIVFIELFFLFEYKTVASFYLLYIYCAKADPLLHTKNKFSNTGFALMNKAETCSIKIKIERSQKLCLYLYKQREEIQCTVRTGNTTKLTGSSNI